MRTLSKIVMMATIAIAIPAHALQIKVVSNNKDLQGIGFTHNGQQYGGMGSEYSKSGVSKGNYSFGVRLNGKDIGCKDESGKKQIKITRSTRVMLSLSGKGCTAKVGS